MKRNNIQYNRIARIDSRKNKNADEQKKEIKLIDSKKNNNAHEQQKKEIEPMVNVPIVIDDFEKTADNEINKQIIKFW